MNISPEAIEELKQIHFEEIGERLNDEEVLDMARDLLRVYRALYSSADRSEE